MKVCNLSKRLPNQIEGAIRFHDNIQYRQIDTQLTYSECLVSVRRQLHSWNGATGHVNKNCEKIKTAIREALAEQPGALPPTTIPQKIEHPVPTRVDSEFEI